MIAKLETDEKLIEYSNNLDINKIERKKDKLRQIELEILKAIGFFLDKKIIFEK